MRPQWVIGSCNTLLQFRYSKARKQADFPRGLVTGTTVASATWAEVMGVRNPVHFLSQWDR